MFSKSIWNCLHFTWRFCKTNRLHVNSKDCNIRASFIKKNNNKINSTKTHNFSFGTWFSWLTMCTVQLTDQLPYLSFLAGSHCFIIMPLASRDFQSDLEFITTCLIVLLNSRSLAVYFYFQQNTGHHIHLYGYTYLMMNITMQNWSNFNNLEHHLISIRLKSILKFVVRASVQQNSITKERQVTRRWYEGEVGQQNLHSEQSNHWLLLNLVFWNTTPRYHLCVSETVSDDRLQIVSMLRWLSDGNLSQ